MKLEIKPELALELSQMEENLAAFFAAQALPGTQIWRNGILVAETGIDQVNRCLITRSNATRIQAEDIQEVLNDFAARNQASQWAFCLDPKTGALEQAFLELGMTEAACLPVQRLIPSEAIPADFVFSDIQPALHLCTTREELELWADCASCAYPFGGAQKKAALAMLERVQDKQEARFFQIILEDQLVGTIFTFSTGSVDGYYWGCTVPAFRNRGIAAHMVRQLAEDSVSRGSIVGYNQASIQGQALYRRLGFSDIGTMKIYTHAARQS